MFKATPMHTTNCDHSRFQRALILAPSMLLVPALLIGCASGGIQNPLRGPSDARFTTLVERNCGGELVGGESVSELLERDSSFRQLAERLYSGDISNDEFVNMLLQEYPADDANIPATGCVVDQLARCLNGKCDTRAAPTADEIAAREMDAQRDAAIDELPAADRDTVEGMTENFDSTPMEPMEPLPSQDPSVMDTAAERVETIDTPTEP